MTNGRPSDLAAGGVCAWQLPLDASGPPLARSLLEGTMTALGLDRELIENGKLAVSEVSTNAFQHANTPQGLGPVTPPELWIWARTAPVSQLVVSVFDGRACDLPRSSGADLLDERGKGLDILTAVTAEWDSHPSRSRVTRPAVQGKAVRFCLPLPHGWPGRAVCIPPDQAAHTLLLALGALGITGKRHSNNKGVSMLEMPGVNVWVEPKHFTWQARPGFRVRHPLLDLQEATEHLVEHIERDNSPRSP